MSKFKANRWTDTVLLYGVATHNFSLPKLFFIFTPLEGDGTFPGPIRSYILKENRIGSAVRDIWLLLKKDDQGKHGNVDIVF